MWGEKWGEREFKGSNGLFSIEEEPSEEVTEVEYI